MRSRDRAPPQLQDVRPPLNNVVMRSVFIDESKAKDFILCAVSIDNNALHLARSVTRQQVMPGQRYVHFVSESRNRKLAILNAYSNINLTADFFIVKDGTPAQRRSKALRQLVRTLPSSTSVNLIFDNDENYTSMDREILREELTRMSMVPLVSYSHLPSRNEPLLWLPDALAWTKAKGKEWNRQLEKFSSRTHLIEA